MPEAKRKPSATQSMPDVQSQSDARNVPLDRAGIKGARRPICFDDDGQHHHTVAMVDLFVNLDAERRGVHMSRLVELLEQQGGQFSIGGFQALLDRMTELQQSGNAHIALQFPLFLEKEAPVTKISGLVDYDVTISGDIRDRHSSMRVRIVAPVTSLCPCSRDISRYGAHNQRSHITLSAEIERPLSISRLIRALESQGSSELYSVLKRADEQFVTERAYDNPKFVEDIARDVAILLKDYDGLGTWCVEVENFESIHNYSAYARIESADADIKPGGASIK